MTSSNELHVMTRTLLLSTVSLVLILPLVSCTEPRPSESLRERNLRNNPINELRVSAAQQTLVEGQRTRLSAMVMMGDSVHSVAENTSFYVEGPGEIVRDDDNVYYVAGSPTENKPAKVYGIIDPAEYGHSQGEIESNRVDLFVVSKEEHGVAMPDVDSFERNTIEEDDVDY
jgi:hypothetical protein